MALAPAARAQDVDLASAGTFSLYTDARLAAADGEVGWLADGFGKLLDGSEVGPRLGHVDLVWQPRFGWAVSATVVASAQEDSDLRAGISEAFLSFKSHPGPGLRISGRAGLMWPPISLEHEGADWHVADTITPSAINSWVAEEVRPLAAEANLAIPAGTHRFELTGAMFSANDTAGALLTFRGWALHDAKVLDGKRWPLPKLSEEAEYIQPQYTHPLLDVLPGFARRPGYYAKLAWSPPSPFRVELFRYDNRGDPEAVNQDLEWAWATRFNQIALLANLSEAVTLKAQAMEGRTEMGLEEAGRYWIDGQFRAAYALVSVNRGNLGAAVRGEAFKARQRGSLVGDEDDERGWAATLAAHRDIGEHLSIFVEALRVDSRRNARVRIALAQRQTQHRFQIAIRGHW